jgi:lycopene cyclase domain-containing protein
LYIIKTQKLLEGSYQVSVLYLSPFFIVNGVLTGSFIENEVVWYNNAENLNIRMFTIPVEDTIYALSMLLTVFVLLEHFEAKKLDK